MKIVRNRIISHQQAEEFAAAGIGLDSCHIVEEDHPAVEHNVEPEEVLGTSDLAELWRSTSPISGDSYRINTSTMSFTTAWSDNVPYGVKDPEKVLKVAMKHPRDTADDKNFKEYDPATNAANTHDEAYNNGMYRALSIDEDFLDDWDSPRREVKYVPKPPRPLKW